MLVLTRRPGQSVYIGDDVKITLVEIKGNQVRIGIDAPSTVRIFREEIYLQILEENKSAAVLSAAAELPSDLKGMAAALGGGKGDTFNKFTVEKKRPPRKKDAQEGEE